MQFSDDTIIKEELSQSETIEHTLFLNCNFTDNDISERNSFKDLFSF